jgi:type II secretory pathway pseudopilin PulG
MLVVVAVIGIASAIALPKLLGTSQLIASAGLQREIMAHLRFARQQAMGQRTVMTFRYDDSTKLITIINHNETGVTFDPLTNGMIRLPGNLAASADATPDTIVEQYSLPKLGVAAGDIKLGRPSGASTAALTDGVQMVTNVPNSIINITFQPDGSVVNALNQPLTRSLFIFNQKIEPNTAFAISVLGTTGRIKLWRYSDNAKIYFE